MYSYILFGIIGLSSIYVFTTLRSEYKAPTEQLHFETKFTVIVERLNKLLFNNKAKLVALTSHNYILYSEDDNQKVVFNIHNHKLLVTWSYQYHERDFSHTEEFDYTTKTTVFKQEKWVNELLLKLSNLRQDFKYAVLSKMPLSSRVNISSTKSKSQWQKYY